MTTKKRRDPGDGAIYPYRKGFAGQLDLGIGSKGERRRKTVYGKTRQEVKQKLNDAKLLLRQRGDLATSETPLHKWLEFWLDNIAAKRLKPNTWRSYRTAINHHIVPSIGNVRLGKLGAQHLRKLYNDLTSPERETGPLSPTTAHNAHRILAAALKDAMIEGKVHRNIAAEVRAPSKADATRTALSTTAAKAILRAADDRLSGRWLLALLYGMRQGERLGMRWSHVDFETNLIDLSWSLARISWAHGCGEDRPEHVARSCPRKRVPIPAGMAHVRLERNYALLTPKTKGSVRVVPMLPPIRAMLEQRRDAVETERPAYAQDHDLVWCETDGSPIDPKDDWAAWKSLLDAAGVPPVTLHEARNTAATLLLEAGVDAKVIGSIIGHSQITTTRAYQRVSTELARQALEASAQRLELPSVGGAA